MYYDTDVILPQPHRHDKENGVRVIDILKFFMHHPEHREAAGLNITNKIIGEDTPRTRWDRIIEHTESAAGHPELKTEWEKLKHGKPNKPAYRRSSDSDK
jgi:hypothetical protein